MKLRQLALELDLPLLTAATNYEKPAHSVKVEWLIEKFVDGEVKRGVDFNYTQIFRAGTAEHVARDIEKALRYGERKLDLRGPDPRGFMGGWEFYLDSPPTVYDTFDLRVLRPLTVFEDPGWNPEWLAEVSVVIAAREPW